MKIANILIPLSLLVTNVSISSEDNGHGNKQSETKTLNTTTRSSRVVWLDPATGKIVSKKPEGVSDNLRLSNAEKNAISRSDVGLVPKVMPDGHVMVDLQGRYKHMSTITIDSDGTQKHRCNSKVADHKHDEKGGVK